MQPSVASTPQAFSNASTTSFVRSRVSLKMSANWPTLGNTLNKEAPPASVTVTFEESRRRVEQVLGSQEHLRSDRAVAFSSTAELLQHLQAVALTPLSISGKPGARTGSADDRSESKPPAGQRTALPGFDQ